MMNHGRVGIAGPFRESRVLLAAGFRKTVSLGQTPTAVDQDRTMLSRPCFVLGVGRGAEQQEESKLNPPVGEGDEVYEYTSIPCWLVKSRTG